MMSRAAARFTQADITRAARAMTAAGLRVSAVRIDRDGKIEIICADEKPQEAPAEVPRSLAEWKRQRDGQG